MSDEVALRRELKEHQEALETQRRNTEDLLNQICERNNEIAALKDRVRELDVDLEIARDRAARLDAAAQNPAVGGTEAP